MPSKPTVSTHMREKLTELGGGAVAVEPGDGTEPYVRWAPIPVEDRDKCATVPLRNLRTKGSR